MWKLSENVRDNEQKMTVFLTYVFEHEGFGESVYVMRFLSLVACVDSSTQAPEEGVARLLEHVPHTPSYCEENVWKLCEAVRNDEQLSNGLSRCFAVFVSNERKVERFCCSRV